MDLFSVSQCPLKLEGAGAAHVPGGENKLFSFVSSVAAAGELSIRVSRAILGNQHVEFILVDSSSES